MKVRLILIATLLGIFVAPAQAQYNCTKMSVFKSGDAKTYNSGNQYIASETVTYTVTCTDMILSSVGTSQARMVLTPSLSATTAPKI